MVNSFQTSTIMLVNQYTIPKDQLKDPIDDDVSFLKKKIIFVYDFFLKSFT